VRRRAAHEPRMTVPHVSGQITGVITAAVSPLG